MQKIKFANSFSGNGFHDQCFDCCVLFSESHSNLCADLTCDTSCELLFGPWRTCWKMTRRIDDWNSCGTCRHLFCRNHNVYENNFSCRYCPQIAEENAVICTFLWCWKKLGLHKDVAPLVVKLLFPKRTLPFLKTELAKKLNFV